MSQESVELVRRWIWAFENDRDTFMELTHPEIEWAPFEENHTVFHGVDGAMQIRAGWLDSWAEHWIDLQEVIERGNDVVVSMHLSARGKGSGVEVDVRLYPHVRVRDGKVAYIFEYEDRADALKAAGISG